MSKALLIISVACLLFITFQLTAYYLSLESQIIQILVEMFSIPAMAFPFLAFLFSLINVFRRKKEYNLVLGINILTIIIVTAATLADYH